MLHGLAILKQRWHQIGVSFCFGVLAILMVALACGRTAGQAAQTALQLHTPDALEDRRASAEKTFEEGQQQEKQGTAKSLRQALEKYQEALQLWHALGDGMREAVALDNMGVVYGSLGDKQKALDYFNQALPIRRAVGDRAGEATTLNSIGGVYSSLGEKQKALDYHNLALPIRREVGDRVGEAITLSNLGAVYSSLGEEQKALDYYKQALPIRREVGDLRGEAITLSNLGEVYDSLGEKQKALDYYKQSLPISRAVGARREEATTLNDIGLVYDSLGEKQNALDYYNQALPIRRDVGDRRGEAATLTNIGVVHSSLGEKRKALDYYNQALPIRRAVGDRAGEAITLNSIGGAFNSLGEKQKALDYFNQALPIRRAVGDRLGEAITLNSIGGVFSSLGENQKALDYFNQALPIRRAVGDRRGEAITLSNLGAVYSLLGEKQKTLESLNRAVALERSVKDPLHEGNTLDELMKFWKSEKRPRLAIFFGKQAVNSYQQVRSNIQGLEKDTQKAFATWVGETYRRLAALLIEEGRLAEAEQVLKMLKLEEYIEFTRRSGPEISSLTAPVPLTPDEMKSDKRYREMGSQSTALGEEWGRLRAQKNRTTEQEQRLGELSAKLQAANDAFLKFLDGLTTELGKPRDHTVEKEVSGLQKILRKLDSGTVALYTLVGEDKLHIIVVTPEVKQAREYSIAATDLRSKVFEFRQALLNYKSDPLPMAQELYRILLGPVAKDLEGAHAKTLMWSLDDVLRYVPMAALHDGHSYVVENYRTDVFTPASIPQLAERPSVQSWSGLGVGVSKSYGGFAALPMVAGELHGIIREQAAGSSEGVLVGSVMLDEDFTTLSLEHALERNYPVVHIASHFAFRPGNETDSFLLLGGTAASGERLSVAQIRRNPNIYFRDTEVLTLSACDTATSGEARGKEVDGLGYLLEEKGAKSVVATLWRVADESTGILMQKFYQGWTGPSPVSKAEALRRAQLVLLHGAVSTSESAPAPASFSHPYFWAPFILIGNWR